MTHGTKLLMIGQTHANTSLEKPEYGQHRLVAEQLGMHEAEADSPCSKINAEAKRWEDSGGVRDTDRARTGHGRASWPDHVTLPYLVAAGLLERRKRRDHLVAQDARY